MFADFKGGGGPPLNTPLKSYARNKNKCFLTQCTVSKTCHKSQQFNVLAELTILAANFAVTQRLIHKAKHKQSYKVYCTPKNEKKLTIEVRTVLQKIVLAIQIL